MTRLVDKFALYILCFSLIIFIIMVSKAAHAFKPAQYEHGHQHIIQKILGSGGYQVKNTSSLTDRSNIKEELNVEYSPSNPTLISRFTAKLSNGNYIYFTQDAIDSVIIGNTLQDKGSVLEGVAKLTLPEDSELVKGAYFLDKNKNAITLRYNIVTVPFAGNNYSLYQLGGFNNPENHFDADAIQESTSSILQGRERIVELLYSSLLKDSIDEKAELILNARIQLGRVLHTIHDFYAHSNYIYKLFLSGKPACPNVNCKTNSAYDETCVSSCYFQKISREINNCSESKDTCLLPQAVSTCMPAGILSKKNNYLPLFRYYFEKTTDQYSGVSFESPIDNDKYSTAYFTIIAGAKNGNKDDKIGSRCDHGINPSYYSFGDIYEYKNSMYSLLFYSSDFTVYNYIYAMDDPEHPLYYLASYVAALHTKAFVESVVKAIKVYANKSGDQNPDYVADKMLTALLEDGVLPQTNVDDDLGDNSKLTQDWDAFIKDFRSNRAFTIVDYGDAINSKTFSFEVPESAKGLFVLIVNNNPSENASEAVDTYLVRPNLTPVHKGFDVDVSTTGSLSKYKILKPEEVKPEEGKWSGKWSVYYTTNRTQPFHYKVLVKILDERVDLKSAKFLRETDSRLHDVDDLEFPYNVSIPTGKNIVRVQLTGDYKKPELVMERVGTSDNYPVLETVMLTLVSETDTLQYYEGVVDIKTTESFRVRVNGKTFDGVDFTRTLLNPYEVSEFFSVNFVTVPKTCFSDNTKQAHQISIYNNSTETQIYSINVFNQIYKMEVAPKKFDTNVIITEGSDVIGKDDAKAVVTDSSGHTLEGYNKFFKGMVCSDFHYGLNTLSSIKSTLEGQIIGENLSLDLVTNKINLPSSYGVCSISWEINDPSIINPSGAINRPFSGMGNAKVSLTATLKVGNMLDQKKFDLIVPEFTNKELSVLDVDRNNTVNATDGLLISRYIEGNAVIDSDIKLSGVQNNSSVVSNIKQIKNLLDVDKNGVVNSIDGVLILRRLNGASIIDTGLVLPPGQTNETVIKYIDSLIKTSVEAGQIKIASETAPAPVPRTGQTVSYADGDDGDLQPGVSWPDPRFTDNGDGTVKDNLTGLVWMKNADCWGTQTWANALSKVASLNAGSASCSGYTTGTHTDWRLPNREELISITDDSRSRPALSSGHPFSGVQTSYYWSSTTHAGYSDGAWIVYLDYGDVYSYVKTNSYYVWPVRGGQ
ncbi:MAG: DUF1566 domain-containing protein [Magnetococcus sp. YQC-9]